MNGKADYYEVLGVSRDASTDDIRRAFRRLARDHHPDLNQGDAGAGDRFKEVAEAYEVLRDPTKRGAYDRFGHAGVRSAAGSGGPDFGDLGDIFEQFFGFGGRGGGRRRGHNQPLRGDDLRTRARLPFEEAVFGAVRTIQIRRMELCDTCDGSGGAPGSETTTCATCQGSGEVRRVQQSVFGAFVNVQPCADCGGRGERVGKVCPECGGTRRASRKRTLEVDVPAGVEDNTQIRLAGEGDHGLFGGPPGDLYVALAVEEHAVFDRQGNDLHIDLWLNAADAALGAEVEVPTLEGATLLKVPPGTQTGDEFRLDGLGVPYLRRHGRGAQVVTAFVKTPERLNRQQRELLEELRRTLPDASVARRNGGLWDRVKEKLT